METQAEANTRFWRLVNGDSGLPVTANRVRHMLLENRHSFTGPTININAPGGSYRETPIIVAIQEGNLPIIEVLLEFGAECNPVHPHWQGGVPPMGETEFIFPLHCAMYADDNGIEMMRLLINSGASTTAIEPRGMTCLHIAGLFHHATDPQERLQLLLDNIPSLQLPQLLSSQREDVLQTPLMDAIEHPMIPGLPGVLALMLIDVAGSDLELHNDYGFTPMMLCIHTLHVVDGPVVLGELLRHGANTDTQIVPSRWSWAQDIGNTALHEAVNLRRGWAIEMLLDAGADQNVVNNNGYTPRQLTNIPRIVAIFTAFELRRAKCVAFAMGHHNRLGTGSLSKELSHDTLRVILEEVLQRVMR
jgi:Ankyrin repeat